MRLRTKKRIAPRTRIRRSFSMRMDIRPCSYLCDDHSRGRGVGGAVEGGAPEFIDLLTSENTDYQAKFGEGFKWLDDTCMRRYGKVWLDCGNAQQSEILDLIAYRRNVDQDASLDQANRVLSLSAQLRGGWVLHQQDRHSLRGLQGQYLPDRVSGLSASTGCVILEACSRRLIRSLPSHG